ncbi:MAG: hypothetical protein KA536_15835 [Saprospiraceae bacterium]|nr:hypothetical protein [Saprospiraceae bacterium]
MVQLEKLSRLFIYLHYDWSFVIRDVDVEESFGRVWIDVDRVAFIRRIWICETITSLTKRCVKNKWVDISLYPGENK